MRKALFDQQIDKSIRNLKYLNRLSNQSRDLFLPQGTADLVEANKLLKQEIRNRKKAQKALEEDQRRSRGIFDQTIQLIFVLKLDGTVVEANKTALETLKYSYGEVIRKPFWGMKGWSSTKEVQNRLKQAIRKAGRGELVRLEIPSVNVDQKAITIDISIKPIWNNKMQVQWLILEGRDITDLKQTEEILRESEKRLRYLSSQILTAQENERKRVAQEIHDGIAQYLSAVKYRVEDALQYIGRNKKEKVEEALRVIIPVIQEAINEVRKICMDLRPLTLDDIGILATISWFCREFQANFPTIRIEKKISLEEKEIPFTLKTVIYRIFQEVLNNIAKHSGADFVELSLGKNRGSLELLIKDNGQGFDQKKVLSIANFGRGLGLASMKERAELSGGKLTIKSNPGVGTQVKAEWKSAVT